MVSVTPYHRFFFFFANEEDIVKDASYSEQQPDSVDAIDPKHICI